MGVFDVAFTGLVLVCVPSQGPDCASSFGNMYSAEAHAVRARPGGMACGIDSTVLATDLTLVLNQQTAKVEEDPASLCTAVGNTTLCDIPEGDICIESSGPSTLIGTNDEFLRLTDLDHRAGTPRLDRLEDPDFVSTSVFFSAMSIRPGRIWESPLGEIPWQLQRRDHHDDVRKPRGKKTAQIVARTDREQLTLEQCETGELLLRLELVDSEVNALVVFRNYASSSTSLPGPDDDGFVSLPYLNTYYPLLDWGSSGGTCPESARFSPRTLECEEVSDEFCREHPQASTVYWPSVLAHP